ncbi:MFS transporter [Kitasatospora paracochleata]|uniref:MFS family permease n=1 Tax=Kitasatospora paracochleata TaxID=58354 RepID=A0ABT1J9R3_9ACTN|nr:MFS transporter [Kitasatospora paracochleata]MCP2314200.1 MFS family permease [Kitasatospora paracochleata]
MRLLRRGPVVLLWGAQTASVFGDRLYALAVMWLAWQRSGGAAMGLVAVAESVPYIVLGTVGGRVTERFTTLRALAGVDVVRMVLVAGLPWTWEAFGTPGLLVSAGLLGVGGALFDPNLGALVPDLVRPDEVQAVNGLMDLTARIARVAGPASAGGLLAVLPVDGLFWLDAGTFALSAAALAALGAGTARRPEAAPASAPAAPGRVPRARALVRTHPETGVVLAVHGIAIFAGAVSIVMPALVAVRLGGGVGMYGVMLAATGAGSIVGNAVAGNVRLPRSLPAFYCVAWAVSGVLMAVTGSVSTVAELVAVSAAYGAVSPFLAVALSTHLAQFPPAARRRLLTLDQTVIRTMGTLAMVGLPALAAAHPRAGFTAGGLATAAVGIAGCVMVVWWARTRTPLPGAEPVLESVGG